MAYLTYAGSNKRLADGTNAPLVTKLPSEVFDLRVIAGPGFGLDWMCVALGIYPGGFLFLARNVQFLEETPTR